MTQLQMSTLLRMAILLAVLVQTACTTGTGTVPFAETKLQRQFDAAGIDLSLSKRGKVILVNIPAFELLAIEGGREIFRSRIIVGTPQNPTPLIDTHVTSVRFRPSWRPTPSMVASGEYEDRVWPPGPDNPLGLAAVRLEPPLLVYLHDTNRRDLFEKPYRALSHGCIRVDRWDDLVGWILNISPAEVHRRAAASRTRDDPAPPIPVLIRYYTRFPDRTGRVIIHPDVYGLAPESAPMALAYCALE